MLMAKSKKGRIPFSAIMMLSAWGFALVVSSFLFFYIGYWLDEKFNTAPAFMIGLFMLAIFLCIGRFYREVWLKRKIW